MLKAGEMARVGSGRLVKICSITNYTAECIWFDHRGDIHTRDFDIDALQPFWLAATPRSLWPEINEMPDTVVAALEAQSNARRSKRINKQRLSNKIKRMRAAEISA